MSDFHAKVAKLLALSERAGTEAEAASALAMAEKLMAAHGITAAQANDALREKNLLGKHVSGAQRRHETARLQGSVALLCEVADFYDGPSIYFYGPPPKVQLAVGLMAMLRNVGETEWQSRRQRRQGSATATDRTARASFFAGFRHTVAREISGIVRQRTPVGASAGGTDMVAAEQARLQAELCDQKGLRISAVQAPQTAVLDPAAYAAGRAAGEKADLTGGIGASAAPKSLSAMGAG